MKSLSLAITAALLIAGAAQAAPANAPRPTDLTSTPPSTDAPVNAPRPTGLTDKPAPTTAILVPAVQKARCISHAQDKPAADAGSRSGVGVLKAEEPAPASRPQHN